MHREHIGGLRELWLRNGYEPGSSGSVKHRDPEGLTKAIAIELCCSHHRLSPDGIRFLRRLLELSQDEADDQFGLVSGTFTACETGAELLDAPTLERLRGDALAVCGREVAHIPEQCLAPAQKLVFSHSDYGWHCDERVIMPALLFEPPDAAPPD